MIDLRFFAERVFDRRDQILELDRFAFAQIENVEQRPVVFERGHRALNDVVDVSVIAARGAVAELVDRLAGMNAFGELMNGQIGTLARAVNREVTQRDDAHPVKMRISRTKKFAGDLGRGVRTDRLREMQVFRERNRFRNAVNRRARRKNESLDAGHARRFEEMKRAVDVRVVIKLRILNGWPHARARGQMHDGVEFFARETDFAPRHFREDRHDESQRLWKRRRCFRV